MKTHPRVSTAILIWILILSACASPATETPATPTPAPTATITPSPTPRPERNIALNKPVRVSASWVVDPPERAVNGNPNDWWGAGGPVPAWIEVDLGGLYSISRIKVINQGPTGSATYHVFGRGLGSTNQLLHSFKGNKYPNQTLEFSPGTPWPDIATIRIEINSGSGWVGLGEIQVFSRDDPKPLPLVEEITFLSQVDMEALAEITPENAILTKQLAMLGRGPINDLAWAPDGQTLAAAGPLGIWLYDPAALEASPRLLQDHTRDVRSVAFSPDGTQIFSASQDGTVKQWETATGKLKRTLPLWNDFSHEVGSAPREKEVWSMAFSPDMKTLASGNYDGTLRLWDLATGKQTGTLTGHAALINLLAFNSDGTRLASSDVKGNVYVWDVSSRKQRATLASQGQVQSLIFSPDGKTLAYGGTAMTVRLWDTVMEKESAELTEHSGIMSLAFSPDGLTLASSSLIGTVLLYDTEETNSRTFKEHVDWIKQMAYSPDGKVLATYGWDGTLRLWEIATAVQSAQVSTHTSAVNSVAFSPDGALIASGGDDNAVRLWEVETNRLHATLWGHGRSVTSVAFSPDGNLIASGSFDATVRLWETASGALVNLLKGHKSYVRTVAFSPDGTLVASGSTDKTVRVWEVATGQERATLTGHTGEVESVMFSPDGKWLVSASADKSLRVWEVATGKENGVIQGNLSSALDVAISPDGAGIVSVGGDHALYAWNWKIIAGKSVSEKRFPSIGHPGWVLAVDFAPSGKLIASANLSTTSYYLTPGEIHLYLAETGYPYALLRGHTKRILSVAFSPDGKLLASGSADGSIRLWGVRTDEASAGPVPTLQATPAAPTSAPAVSFQDEFNGALAEGWTWLNENSARWNLKEKPGCLRIYASPDKTGNQNLLLRSAQGDFTITTHVFFRPEANFQIAGLVIYQDESNFLQFGRAFCNVPGTCVGNGLYFDNLVGGAFAGDNFATSVSSWDEAYLRLERRGGMVKALFSSNGVSWIEIGMHLLPSDFQVTGVGLTASQDTSQLNIPADFDFFELAGSP